LGAASTDDRFGGARNLLDFGFANYTMFTPKLDDALIDPIPVFHGTEREVAVTIPEAVGIAIEKSLVDTIAMRMEIASDLQAPVEAGQTVGELIFSTAGGEEIARYALKAASGVEEMTLSRAFCRFFAAMTAGYAA
ncbi:MAG: hypothetical protein IKV35_03490, partial [Clostridia bacterium]|nr:hypothetical protein [Clostridia bacterium]